MRKGVRTEEPKFESEAALCARFTSLIGEAWIAYNETAGWDILLVRKVDGFQIGIQAKMAMNLDVINQALGNSYFDRNGPDCRAVLVPAYVGLQKLERICEYLGLTILRCWPEGHGDLKFRYSGAFDPVLPAIDDTGIWSEAWHERAPYRRCRLPDFVPDVIAGSKAPVQLTDWKVRALKIAVILELRGHVTRADFKALNIDVRRWIAQEWLRVEDGKLFEGRQMPRFRAQHPRVYAEIKDKSAKWMPAEAVTPDPKRQGSML